VTATAAAAGPAAAGRAAELAYPRLRIDQLLARTAAVHPDRVAIRAGGRALSFAELDAAVSGCAAAIRELTGGERTVVAVSSILAADYAIAYYAAIRSGNIALPVNPLLPEPALLHQLATAGVTVGFLSAPVRERLRRIEAALPRPVRVVPIGAGELPVPDPALPDLALPDLMAAGDPELDQVAALHFTSGTTGAPKAVMLTHRNITANAVQVARAHLLDADSTSVVCFPTYHPMHLNSAVVAGATQVLNADPDLTAAVSLANRFRATHFYSIPAWLIRLAGRPAWADLRLHSVRFVASGGAALPAPVAAVLQHRLGVPVVQGYGLAETAPLTHFDLPDAPAVGSVGPVLAGTQCRIVGVETREPVAARELGEVQVRGPQLMAGYLNHPEPAEIDPDGWFSTGDVGWTDERGCLFLVDRLKDVFKHDNWLVSPTEIEAVLLAHPAVADCVVVDRPDEVHGAEPHAYLVLAEPRPALDRILGWANDQLPHFKQVRHAEVVPAIPRTPNGKVPRRELRGALLAELTGGSKMVILVNRFTLTASPERFEEVFKASSEYMRSQPGFLNHTLVKSLRSPNVYVNIAHWSDATAHLRVVQSEGFAEHIRELAEVARAEPDLYAVVDHVEPATS
jgi:long-chain acyl-CoA synthetase